MARRYEDERYLGGDTEIQIDLGDLPITTGGGGESQIDQVSPAQITADQNNYALVPGTFIRLSTDASRTVTGFAGARPEATIANVGAQDLVIAHDSASSDAANRILCHGSANITVGPNGLLFIFYDYQTTKWRAR